MYTEAKIRIFGNVGSDLMRPISDNDDFIKFSVAVNRLKKGEKKTTWYEVICNNAYLARKVERCVIKGERIFIEGELDPEEYTNKNHERKTKLVVYLAHIIDLLPASDFATKEYIASRVRPKEEIEDDGIPF